MSKFEEIKNATKIAVVLEEPAAPTFLKTDDGKVNEDKIVNEITKNNKFDNPSARLQRIQDFQTVSNVSLPALTRKMVDPSFVLSPTETVIATIYCCEIEGFPASTEESKVQGLISCSLIQSADGNAKLLFSITEGELFLSVDESFLTRAITAASGCCCFSAQESAEAGSTTVEYKTESQQISQDCTLSVDDNVISAMSYRKNVRKVEGSFSARKFSNQSSATSCCSCFSCCKCCSCCNCSCCSCCKFDCCFTCCAPTVTASESSTTLWFNDRDTVVSNLEPPTKHDMRRGADNSDRNAVNLYMVPTAQEDIAVVLHYVNPLSLKAKTCVMKLSIAGKNADDVYDSARLFSTAIGRYRTMVSVDASKKYAPKKYTCVKKNAKEVSALEGMFNDLLGGGIKATTEASEATEGVDSKLL